MPELTPEPITAVDSETGDSDVFYDVEEEVQRDYTITTNTNNVHRRSGRITRPAGFY